MDATKMKSSLKLLLFLLLFGFSPVLTVFHDDGALRAIQPILNNPPFNGQPEAEMERIFASPIGPLQMAMTEYPRHYIAVFFTAFEEYLARIAFVRGHRGQGNHLLVLLKDHNLLPEVYLPQTTQSVNVHFNRLYDIWATYADRTLVPSLGVVIERRPPPDAQVPVPPLLRPLLLTEARPEEEVRRTWLLQMGIYLPTIRYGDLVQRFFEVYVGRYPIGTTNRRQLYFVQGRDERPRLRLAVLQAYYWMMVVQPFLQLVESNRFHFPRINPAQLTPTGSRDLGGNGDRDPPNPEPQIDIFGDLQAIQTIVDRLQAGGIFAPTVAEVDRLYEEEGPLERAMRAHPHIYATVLFFTFSTRFEVNKT